MRAAGSALLLHGAGGGAWEWNAWSRVLQARGWRVQAPELAPAAGGLAATRLEDYLRQACAAGADLPRPLAVVGASLGALLALMAAGALRPQALLLVNPLPPAPFHARLPLRNGAANLDRNGDGLVHWRRDASLAGTRAALPDADDATCLYAFRRWRDESRAVVDAARAGVVVQAPACPLRVLASAGDRDVPAELSEALSHALGGDFERLDGSHVGPLLGTHAASVAAGAACWLQVACAGAPVKPA